MMRMGNIRLTWRKKMIIKNVFVYKENQTFEAGEVVMEDGVFRETASQTGEILDGEGCYAIPGLIDIHFHGCMGYDFCDGTGEAIEHMAEYEASQGITSMVPATMTLAQEELARIMTAAGAYENKKGARLAGINMEGPFLNEEKKGAQDGRYIRCCDMDMYEDFQRRSRGLIRLVDLAPETEGAMEFLQAVRGEVTLSLAHTCADYETADRALKNGATHVTHLYNAMPPFSHREPGVIGAAYDNKGTFVELICDGIHIHPAVVRATFDLFGSERIVLVSDSMRAAGLQDGQYTLGGQAVTVEGKRAVLTDGGAIAGSVTNLADCLRTAVQEMGIPLEQAVACATQNPARSIGIYDQVGSITAGKRADLVLLNRDLSLNSVYMDGNLIKKV